MPQKFVRIFDLPSTREYTVERQASVGSRRVPIPRVSAQSMVQVVFIT